jgi:methyltransferase
MVSRRIFTAFVVLLGLQRLLEMQLSRRNERVIQAKGGQETAPHQLQSMKLLHAAWLIAMPLEVYALKRPFLPLLAFLAAILFSAGQALRYTSIRSLGWRWTVRVMTVPGEFPIQTGIYQYLRHPNYLGVALEIAAAPLLHHAYWTALLFSGLNAVVLSRRIRVEERALAGAARIQKDTGEPAAISPG